MTTQEYYVNTKWLVGDEIEYYNALSDTERKGVVVKSDDCCVVVKWIHGDRTFWVGSDGFIERGGLVPFEAPMEDYELVMTSNLTYRKRRAAEEI